MIKKITSKEERLALREVLRILKGVQK